MDKWRGMTQQQILDSIAADPERQKMLAERARLIEERVNRERIESAPLLDDLRRVGIDLESIWDLHRYPNYAEALPVLLEHLHRDYAPSTRDRIARSFAIKEAAPYWDDLVGFLRREPDGPQGIAVAISTLINTKRLDDAIELLLDERLGDGRVLFVRPIKRSRQPRVRALLESLRDHPVLGIEVTRALAGRAPND